MPVWGEYSPEGIQQFKKTLTTIFSRAICEWTLSASEVQILYELIILKTGNEMENVQITHNRCNHLEATTVSVRSTEGGTE